MREAILLPFIVLFHIVASAPSDNSLVITSKESLDKENGKIDTVETSTHPVISEMDITANISNRFAKALVVSKVKNPAQVAKEATFTVVLPEKAFISEFVMEIGGKSYKAYVKAKEEAKDIYDKAVASGQSAAHVAVSARDSNRFTVSVNIEPEAKAVFLLTYEELLERKTDQYELVLNINPGQVVNNLNVKVYINESRPIKFVKTPSLRSGNEISKNEDKLDPSSDIQIVNSTSAVVTFTPDSAKQRQFAKELGIKESDGLSGQFVVQYDVERDSKGGEVLLEDGYFVHFFAPKDLEPLPKHIVFVLDTSGSMGGRKIMQLKDAMYSILSELRKEDVLSIVEFESIPKVWDIDSQKSTEVDYDTVEENYQEPFNKLSKMDLPIPKAATKENIDKAKKVIKQFDASGGTHIIGGLEVALYLVKRQQEEDNNKTSKFQPIIIFLTDGEPNGGIYDTNEITKLVTKLNFENNKAPIFTLSFGYGADKEFLRKVSLKNLGFSRHIYEASDASLQLQDFFKQISSPLLSNINFKYSSDVQKVTKSHFPIYFDGSELVVAGRYEGDAPPILVTCLGPRGPVELQPVIEQPVTPLERLWAYLTVKQTLDERDSADNKTELTQKALDLALKYSFVTDVSSLVVVKPNDTSAVNTEDAAAGNNDAGFGGLSGRIAYGAPVAQSGIGLRAFARSGVPAYHALSFNSYDADSDADSDVLYSPVLTTSLAPPISVRIQLETALPWFASALNSNGTLTLQQGTFELADDTVTTTPVECPKTPLNSTATGYCTLLQDCPEVYSALTDVHVYQQFFCSVDTRFAGVCCPHSANPL